MSSSHHRQAGAQPPVCGRECRFALPAAHRPPAEGAARAIRKAAAWLLLFAAFVLPKHAAATEFDEAEVKAAGLFKIISFAQWQPAAFGGPDAPLIVGVLGNDSVAQMLGHLAEDETWHQRRVVIRQVRTVSAIQQCHVLFLGRSAGARWPVLRAHLASTPVLTVSDISQFARNGGMVQLAIRRNRLHLVINLVAVRTSGLTISSKVLRLAEIVEEEGP